MLFGLSIGLAVALVVYLKSGGPAATPRPQQVPTQSEQQASNAAPAPRSTATEDEPAAPAETAGDETAFSFFDDLSKSEVVVDENEFDFGPGNDAPRVVFIQAGAFRELEDADARQASIALLGYESHIDTAIVGGNLWFRVLIGPLTERAEINGTLRRLRGAGIETALRPVSN
jgi:cell division protein FtsN